MFNPQVKRRSVPNLAAAEVIGITPNGILAPSIVPAPFINAVPHSVTPTRTRILVVDDDDRMCEVLSHVLRRANYEVECVSGAELALGVLAQRTFDMVVCDMHLGGMTGLDLTEQAATLYPDIPFILMTAHRDNELMRSALQRGAVDFIPKPFNSESIPIIIERSIERVKLNRQQAEAQRISQIFSNVQVLAAAIDAKEPYTAEHSRRVARLARATAEAMKLSASEQQVVDWAAQVHDVGKIATPDHILLKNGPLDSAEWEIIRQHPIKGAEIVGQVSDLSYVASIVRHHHERVDGTGYPDRLGSDAIPLLSRIITVCDAFEVMTSNRVYRKCITEEEALRRLQDGADFQFDPAIVTAFLSLPAEIRL